MHIIAAVIFLLLGGVAAILIMRLVLFHFWGSAFKKDSDEQYLKRIADALQ